MGVTTAIIAQMPCLVPVVKAVVGSIPGGVGLLVLLDRNIHPKKFPLVISIVRDKNSGEIFFDIFGNRNHGLNLRYAFPLPTGLTMRL
jgi:hypothetical protein